MIKEKIIIYSITEFLEKGSFKTTMDELAKGLKISKKTIYKFFPSKVILLEKMLNYFQEKVKTELFNIVESDKSKIDKLIEVGSFFAKFSLRMSKTKIIDFSKNEPKLWKVIDNFRTHVLEHVWEVIIVEGKQEGLIVDKNNKIILTIILSSLKGIINPSFLTTNNISIKNAFEEIFPILINGILTEKGRKEFENQEWKIK